MYATQEYVATLPALHDIPADQLAGVLQDADIVKGWIADKPLITDTELEQLAAGAGADDTRLQHALDFLVATGQVVAIGDKGA